MTGMWNFLRSGGLPMVFVLVFGLIALGAAFHFAVRAERRSLGFIFGMAAATLFSTLATSCADVGATLVGAERAFEPDDAGAPSRALHIVVEGFAESTTPGILGFALLALVAMLVASGRRRLDERDGAR
jgi:hypothetical protein